MQPTRRYRPHIELTADLQRRIEYAYACEMYNLAQAGHPVKPTLLEFARAFLAKHLPPLPQSERDCA